MRISDGAMAVLLAHSWPGNIRELKNLMQYISAAHPVDIVLAEHVSERLRRVPPAHAAAAAGRGRDRGGLAPVPADRRRAARARDHPDPRGARGDRGQPDARRGADRDAGPDVLREGQAVRPDAQEEALRPLIGAFPPLSAGEA